MICTNSETVKVVNTVNNSCSFLFGHKDIVTSCDFYQDLIITGCKDGKIYKWTKKYKNGSFIFTKEKKYKAHE